MLFKVNNKGSKCFMNASVLACFIELNTFLSMLNKKTFIPKLVTFVRTKVITNKTWKIA